MKYPQAIIPYGLLYIVYYGVIKHPQVIIPYDSLYIAYYEVYESSSSYNITWFVI